MQPPACPITHLPIVDPVVDPDGHSYEREAILGWLKNHATSPITRSRLTADQLRPNFALKDICNHSQHHSQHYHSQHHSQHDHNDRQKQEDERVIRALKCNKAAWRHVRASWEDINSLVEFAASVYRSERGTLTPSQWKQYVVGKLSAAWMNEALIPMNVRDCVVIALQQLESGCPDEETDIEGALRNHISRYVSNK